MASAMKQNPPPDFDQTSWRGIDIGHPMGWEAGFLAPPGDAGRVVFVDRRFQRLEVQWRNLPKPPDLQQMYKRVAKSFRKKGTRALTGAGEWQGVVRRDEKASIVHAGRYWPEEKCLVEVVMLWPERRDRSVEKRILKLTAPQPAGPTRRWRAMGLSATVPAEFDLKSFEANVGRVRLDFQRPGRRSVGLTLERIAMTRYWLKKPLDEWLTLELPPGYRVGFSPTVNFRSHGGAELHSRQRNPIRGALGLRLRRVDLAWSCPQTERVYRVGVSQRTRGAIDWPEPLEMECCGPVAIAPRGE